MASNKFFTVMVVPEKSNQVRKIVIPSAVFKGGVLSFALLAVLAAIMVLDYANVMNQINENKKLRIENRELRQDVQVFKTKMVTMDNTLDRVKTFVTKLRIITNIEDTGTVLAPEQPLASPGGGAVPAVPAPAVQPAPQPPAPLPVPREKAAPPAPSNVPTTIDETENNNGQPLPAAPNSSTLRPGSPLANPLTTPATSAPGGDFLNNTQSKADIETDTDVAARESPQAGLAEAGAGGGLNNPIARARARADAYEAARSRRHNLLAALMVETPDTFTLSDADSSAFVRGEFEKLDSAYEEVNAFALATEQETQDILARLGEKRALLASTPTRIPTLGYITSDYGVRVNPYDGRRKMHEGLDIANRYGSDVIATADGTVDFAGVKPGYGKIVIIDHGNGIETRYAHNSKLFVATGEKVTRGQRIAAVGNTGHSTGPHCHYEVHVSGLPVDPCWYILDQPEACRNR